MSTRSAGRAGTRLRCVVPLVLLALVTACGDGTAAEQRAARIAADVPDDVVDAVSEALAPAAPGALDELFTSRARRAVAEIERMTAPVDAPLDVALDAAGDLWPESLLAAAVRTYGEPAVGGLWPDGDGELDLPVPSRLLRRPEGRLDDELLQIVRDTETPRPLFQMCLASLCRPESDAMLDDCVSLVRDPSRSPERRKAVLVRLQRFERPLPPTLDELLYQPMGGLDELAAAVLAASGRPVATSLFLDFAERIAEPEYGLAGGVESTGLLAQSAIAFAPDDARLVDAANGVLKTSCWEYERGETTYGDDDGWQARKDLLAGLRRLVAERPALLESDFEADRRSARVRATATLQRAHEYASDLAQRTDDEIDFAAAALAVSGDAYADNAEQFERFVILLEHELQEVDGADEQIAWLRRRLHGPTRRLGTVGVGGLASALSEVLHLHCGNCVGNTVLWVAVAERLGLPVRPMYRPQHVVVAWEDQDGRRRILETTERGIETSMASYREADPMAGWPGSSDEQLLRPMTEVQLLATILTNEVIEFIEGRWKDPPKKYGEALESARRALTLDPDQPLARVAFAFAASRVEGPSVYEAIALLEKAVARTELAPLERLALARGFKTCGARLRAVEVFASIEDEFPDDPRVIEFRALLDDPE